MMCLLYWTDLKWVIGGGVPIFGLLFLVYVVALYISSQIKEKDFTWK